ncbi:MAG: pyridoxal phosphate-dependent aminotransferase [Candidatus Bathyarchaeia archaeon]
MLSKRVLELKPSETLAITAKAKEMKRAGVKIVNLSAGEPDFSTPEHVKNEAFKAMKENFTYYTAASGIPELKNEVSKKLKEVNKAFYEPDQVCISAGAKQGLYAVMQVILNPKDEVLLPTPFWVSYLEQIKLCEAKPVLVSMDEKNKIKADLIEEKVASKTKCLILNSPSNPAGMICDFKELKAIADLALERNFYIISDEVYEFFIYDGKTHVSISSLNEEIREKTILINSFSKTYSMTGWRIGYLAASKKIIEAVSSFQSHAIGNPNSIAQKAALKALRGPQDFVYKMVKAFDERRKFMVKRLNEIPGLNCIMPEGAFYAFPEITQTKLNSINFAEKLLEEAGVAVVPGAAFGNDFHIRLSYAASIEEINEGMNRLEKFCRKIKN